MIGSDLFAVAGTLLAAQYVTTGLYLRRLGKQAQKIGILGQPRVSLLRPVCGRDDFDNETLASSFLQDYPNYEIIFCAPSEKDPSVALVRQLIAEHPNVAARLLIGLDQVTGNPKLNNLWKGWNAATSDWICMSDSNLMLPADYLSQLVAAWGPETGLVSCPAIGTRPDNFGGSLECAFLNSNQARIQFTADSIGHGFAQGKTLFWNRAMLDAAGGIKALGRHLAEDATATKIVYAQAKRVDLPQLPFSQPIGTRKLRQVWDRHLRWSRVRRDGFPWLFAGEFLNGPAIATVFFALAMVMLGRSPVFVLAYLGLWYAPEVWLIRRARWPSGWKDFAALPVRDLLLPVMWAVTYLRRDIEWRGNAMSVPAPTSPSATIRMQQ